MTSKYVLLVGKPNQLFKSCCFCNNAYIFLNIYFIIFAWGGFIFIMFRMCFTAKHLCSVEIQLYFREVTFEASDNDVCPYLLGVSETNLSVITNECTKMCKNQTEWVCHFRCTARRGPERPQIRENLFSGYLRGDQPGCWLWRHHLHGGQTPVRCSVMLWMTSCPWPAVWTDPVGYHCSACTPSAGSKNVCCHLL